MIYGNNTLTDRITIDIFSNWTLTNRILKVYDVEPYFKGQLQSFPAPEALAIPVTNDVIKTIDGKKYVTFTGGGVRSFNSIKAKSAMRWFAVYNNNGQFLYAGRVGTFLHGLPLNTERLIVDDLSQHELYTFQFRFEMDESDADSRNYTKDFSETLIPDFINPFSFEPTTYYTSLGTAVLGGGMPATYNVETYGDIIWMNGATANANGWLGHKFISPTENINLKFNCSGVMEEIWLNGVKISDGTDPNDSINNQWSELPATVIAGETNFISIKVSNISGLYGFAGQITDSTTAIITKTNTTWVTG